MRITTILTSSAIALAASVGSASADENFITLDGFTAFHTLAGVQAVPLDTDEMASITARHWVKQKWNKNGDFIGPAIEIKDNGIWNYTADMLDRDHGVKFFGPGGTNFVAFNDPDAHYFPLVGAHGEL